MVVQEWKASASFLYGVAGGGIALERNLEADVRLHEEDFHLTTSYNPLNN